MHEQHDPEKVAQALLAGANDLESAADIVSNAVNEFLRVELAFDGLLRDEAVRELTKANKENLSVVIGLIQSHNQLSIRENFISALLRQISNFATRFGSARFPEDFIATMSKITSLKDKVYGELKLLASDIILRSKVILDSISQFCMQECRT